MKKQQGMTLIGMLFTMACVIIIGIVVMRIIPVYLQYYSIVQSVKALNSSQNGLLVGDPLSDSITLRASVTKRLDINGIEDLKEKELSIVPGDAGKYLVKIKYQVTRPLVYNMSLLFDFDKTIEVKPGSEN
ncbi:MAG: DUF4845 domain-containing protein [Legionella sp.]|nr:MAG: DUF4845 domain-containing protein [Legionella sp.]